jgi:hypothetical protein
MIRILAFSLERRGTNGKNEGDVCAVSTHRLLLSVAAEIICSPVYLTVLLAEPRNTKPPFSQCELSASLCPKGRNANACVARAKSIPQKEERIW